MGVAEFQQGDVRIIATGGDLDFFRDQTVRGIVVTEATFAARRDQLARFLEAYQQTIDWMYRDPEALQWFADRAKVSVETLIDLILPRPDARHPTGGPKPRGSGPSHAGHREHLENLRRARGNPVQEHGDRGHRRPYEHDRLDHFRPDHRFDAAKSRVNGGQYDNDNG